MQRLCLRLAGLCLATCAWAADPGGFDGQVVVQWLDDPFIAKMQLMQDFAFRDPQGRRWIAPKGHVLDGRSIPLLFREMIGPPFGGEYRKATVVYEYHCHAMNEPWRDVHRMFFDASRSEGVPEMDAKVMYMALYAGGLRWEPRGSRCFASCHAAAESLSWMPAVEPNEVQPLVKWIRQTNPGLDEIDRRLDATIMKPGPHIFTQGFSKPIPANPSLTPADSGGTEAPPSQMKE